MCFRGSASCKCPINATVNVTHSNAAVLLQISAQLAIFDLKLSCQNYASVHSVTTHLPHSEHSSTLLQATWQILQC